MPAGGLRVHTYSSPDPDAVNSYAIETTEGMVVVSTQRMFSEAGRALARFRRTGKPVIAIVIPVPHTDHYGGLKVFREAYPEAAVYASPKTVESMRSDAEGYIASRKAALGPDFPSPDEVRRHLPDRYVKDGEVLTVGGLKLEVIELPNNNAPVNTLLFSPDHGVLFSSEVVENAVTAYLRDGDLPTWIAQVEELETHLLPRGLTLIYPAHNEPAPADIAFRVQLEHLRAYRDLVTLALRSGDDQRLLNEEKARIVAEIERRFPDFAEVARARRAELVELNVGWVAERMAQSRR